MCNSDTAARLAGLNVAGRVIRVGDKYIPLVVNHVGEQVVWSRGMVCVVPGINPGRVGLVGDVDQRHGDLSGIFPFTDVRVCVA